MFSRQKGFSAIETLVAIIIISTGVVTYIAAFSESSKSSYLQLMSFRGSLYINDLIENSYASPTLLKRIRVGGSSFVNCRYQACDAEQFGDYQIQRIAKRAEDMLQPTSGDLALEATPCMPKATAAKFWNFKWIVSWTDPATNELFERETSVDRQC